MPGNLRVAVDWDRDGSFTTGAFDDVTDRVRGGVAGQVEVETSKDLGNVLPQILVGRGQITLGNADRRYSSNNASSPLTGKVRPARPVDVQRIVPTTPTSTTFSLWRGRTDDQEADPDPDRRTVTFGLVDVLQDLRGRKVPTSVGLKRGIRTGDAVTALLDAVGWTAGRDIDPGVSVLPVWWEEGNDVVDSLNRLLTSEGPPASISVGPDGTFIFHDRHHRLLNTASSTSQGTWRESGVQEPVLGKWFRVGESWATIVNDVSVTLDSWGLDRVMGVWSTDEAITISPLVGSGVLDVPFIASDPFTNPQPLVEGVDYQRVSGPALTSAAIGIASSQIGPAGFVRFIHPLVPAVPTVITNVRLRAQPLRVLGTTTVTASSPSSQTAYGVRSLPGSDSIGPWCSPLDAQAIADSIIATRSTPLSKATAKLVVGRGAAGPVSRSTTRAALVLARKVSDRVTLSVPSEGLAGDFYVEGIRHDIAGEDDHTVTATLEQVPLAAPAPTGATAFRFDVAGQGFDQGRFA